MKRIITILLYIVSMNHVFAQFDSIFIIDYVKQAEVDREKFNKFSSTNQDRNLVEYQWNLLSGESRYRMWADKDQYNFQQLEKLDNSPGATNVFDQNGNKVIYHQNTTKNYINLKEMIRLSPEVNLHYLIRDSLIHFNWNTNHPETRDVLGYLVKKATTNDPQSQFKVEVWYAPSIPISGGPDIYWGLPGLILEVNITIDSNDGLWSVFDSSHFKAIRIQKLFSKNKNTTLHYLNKRILSRADHQKMVDEQQLKQRRYEAQGVEKN